MQKEKNRQKRAREMKGMPTKRKLVNKVDDTRSELSMTDTDGENEQEVLSKFDKKDLVEEKQKDEFRRGINR